MENNQQIKRIGIIGGGNGGLELLRMMSASDNVTVSFVVDVNPDAPAMELARRQNIKALTNMEGTLRTEKVDFVIEATGNPETLHNIRQIQPNIDVISSTAAMAFFGVIRNSREAADREALNDLSSVRREIDKSTRDVSKTLHGIEKISNELEVLAINAGIQASRAGEFGKGFAVVAGEVKSTARVARDLAGDIDRIIGEISSMSDKIEQSLRKVM